MVSEKTPSSIFIRIAGKPCWNSDSGSPLRTHQLRVFGICLCSQHLRWFFCTLVFKISNLKTPLAFCWNSTLLSLSSVVCCAKKIIIFFQFSPSWRSEVKWSESCSVVSDSLWPHGLYSPWNSPGQNPGAGSLSLLQVVVPTQGSNPGLLHCG